MREGYGGLKALIIVLFLAGCTSIGDVVQDVGEARDLTKARVHELIQDRQEVREIYRSAVRDETSALKARASAAMLNGDYEEAKKWWDHLYRRLERVYEDHLDIGAKFDKLLNRFRDEAPPE